MNRPRGAEWNSFKGNPQWSRGLQGFQNFRMTRFPQPARKQQAHETNQGCCVRNIPREMIAPGNVGMMRNPPRYPLQGPTHRVAAVAQNGAGMGQRSITGKPDTMCEAGRGSVVKTLQQACVFCASRAHLRCPVCKAWYCSVMCQMDDWYKHKDCCRPPPALCAGGTIEEAPLGTKEAEFPPFSSNKSQCKEGLTNTMMGETSDPERSFGNSSAGFMNNVKAGCFTPTENAEKTLPQKNRSTPVNNLSAGNVLIVERSVTSTPGFVDTEKTVTFKKSFAHTSDNLNAEGAAILNRSITNMSTEDFIAEDVLIPVRSDAVLDDNSSAKKGSVPQRNISNMFANDSVIKKEETISNTSDNSVLEKDAVLKRGIVNAHADYKNTEKVINPKPYMASPPAGHTNSEEAALTKCNIGSAPSSYPETKKTALPKNSLTSTLVNSVCDLKLVPTSLSMKGDLRLSESLLSEFETPHQNQSRLFRMLEVGSIHHGFITLVDNYKKFTVAIIVEGAECVFGDENLRKIPVDPTFKPVKGSVIAAHSPSERTWYRASVLDTAFQKYKVCYIDFGNIEIVTKVKPLPKGPLSELPEFAVLAKLQTKVNPEIQEELEKIIKTDNPVKLKVVSKSESSLIVSLCNPEDENGDNKELAQYRLGPLSTTTTTSSLQESNSVLESKNMSEDMGKGGKFSGYPTSVPSCQKGITPSPEQETEKEVTYRVSSQQDNGQVLIEASKQIEECRTVSLPKEKISGDSCGKPVKQHSIFVVPFETLLLHEKLEEMSQMINKYCSSSPESPYQPCRGEVCLAKFGQDGRWYRAVCVISTKKDSLVIFVDYGNTESVSHANTRKILKEFLEVPCLAVYQPKCEMDAEAVQKAATTGVLEVSLDDTHSHAYSTFTFLKCLKLSSGGFVKPE